MGEIEAIMAIYPLIFGIVDFKLQILRNHLWLYCCSVNSYYHSGGIFFGHVVRPDSRTGSEVQNLVGIGLDWSQMKLIPHEQGELAMLKIIAVHLENISVSQLDFMMGWISHLGIVYGHPWLVLTLRCI